MSAGPIICPCGNQNDRIQKVSSVYAENTASPAYSRTITVSTVLAEKLAPPIEPRAPAIPPVPEPVREILFYRYFFERYGFLSMLVSPLSWRAKLGILLSALIAAFSWFVLGVLAQIIGWPYSFVVVLFIFLLGIISCCLICWLELTSLDKRRMLQFELVDLPNWVESMRQFELADLAIWGEKKQKWEKLYYCYTHDCVFDPCTRDYISPDGMSTLIE